MPQSPTPQRVVWGIVAFEAGLGVLAMALAWLTGVSLRAELVGGVASAVYGLAAALPMLAAMWFLGGLSWEPTRALLQRVRALLLPLLGSCTSGGLAVISLAAGVGEELLFRGVIQTAVAAKAGPVMGVLVASAVFAIGHALTRTYAVLAGMIGLYLGAAYIASGSLITPIVAHAFYDYLALRYLLRD